MAKLKKTDLWNRFGPVIVIVLTTGFLIWFGSRTYCAYRTKQALDKADSQLQKGYAALAAETLEKYRFYLTNEERACKILISAYFHTRRIERLEWACQACLDVGLEFPEAYIGLAATRELTNRETEALQILTQAASKFDQFPDLYYRISQILRRSKRDAEAADALLKAAMRAPQNYQLGMEALEFFSSLHFWPQARMMADRIKSAPTDDPEVKLLIARALLKDGDPMAAAALLPQTQELLNKKPQMRPSLEKAYAEVFALEKSPK